MTARPISVAVGDRIELLDIGRLRHIDALCRRSGVERPLVVGDVGDVVELRQPLWQFDGHAVVIWPQFSRALIWPGGEGKTWRRVGRPT